MIITFCGHSQTSISETTINKIKEAILNKLKLCDDIKFYLGGYGDFDYCVLKILKEIKQTYPKIELIFITPYIDESYNKLKYVKDDYDDSIYPPLEFVPKKFAIIKRNEWMINNSDFVIAYVKHSWGGASRTLNYAISKNKEYINFSDI